MTTVQRSSVTGFESVDYYATKVSAMATMAWISSQCGMGRAGEFSDVN